MRATVPITAARSTLGSVRARSTNPTTPAAPTTTSQRPRTRHHRARASRNPTTSVRLVPDTASRCVSPVVRKSVSTSAGERRVVAHHQRRHQRALVPRACGTPSRAATGAPRPRRATRSRGRARTSGSPCTSSSAASPSPSAGASRPPTRTVAPRAGRATSAPREHEHRRRPGTSSRPRPRTSVTRSRHITWSVRPEVTSTGSEVTVPSTDTTAPSCASSETGLCETWCSRRPVTASAASRTSTAPADQRRAAGSPPHPDEQHGRRDGATGRPRGDAGRARPRRAALPPRPRRRAAASAGRGGRRGRRPGRGSHGDVRGDPGQRRLTDAVDLEQLVDAGEPAVRRRARSGSTRRSPARPRAASRAGTRRRC